ncbi:MAG: hypothetical protein M1839_005563 [Geoglossum umbratile]|nr:MAG: hypothetical protein M1839_005563 [Geoglossum umbratile]
MLRYHLLIAVIIPAALAGNNSTIVVPPKASNHGDPNLLCLPAAWTDIVVFLLGNYVAHAATIKTLPGESPIGVMIAAVAALLFPMAGAVRGLDAIMSFAILGANDLEKAARAQALCMVKKTEGSSRPTGTFLTTAFRGVSELLDLMVRSFRTLTRTHGVRGQSNKYNNIALFSTKVHGRFHIPERFRENYALVPVSWYAKFQHEETVNQSPRKNSLNWVASQFKEPRKSTTTLSCNYNLVKVLIALGQVVYATATLYRTRGNQIARYGYSAFGLTVAPYALMSIVNLIGNIMCPEYPAMYLVWSKDMGALINEMKSEEQEGKEKDGVVTSQSLFDGVVGSLDEDHTAGDINSFTTHFVSMPAIILVAQVLSLNESGQ